MRRGVKRGGFTLVELLVVIAIIGMLIGLLLPAVNKAREQGRRMTCSSQMRQLSQAVLLYEGNRKAFPGYINYVPMLNTGTIFIDPMTGKNPGVTAFVELLPTLERTDLYNAWRSGAAGGAATGNISGKMAYVSLAMFICPTNPAVSVGGTPVSYALNTGCIDVPPAAATNPADWRENGVFVDRFSSDPRAIAGGGINAKVGLMQKVNSEFVSGRDGMSNTMMFSENVDAGNYNSASEAFVGMVWDCTAVVTGAATVQPGGTPPTASITNTTQCSRINDSKGLGASQLPSLLTNGPGDGVSQAPTTFYLYARPSAYHDGGVNVSFCDSRTTFMSDQMDYYVYCLLMSSDGKNCKAPGPATNPLLSATQATNFAVPLDEAWIP